MTVAAATLIAVLDALGVPAATEEERAAAIAAHDRSHWARALPPVIVGRTGTDTPFWVHVTHGDPVGCGCGLKTAACAPACASSRTTGPPYDLDGRLVGEATFELPADLPLGYHLLHLQVGSSDASDPGDRVAGLAGPPAAAGGPTGLGSGHSAVQREFATVMGHRRSDRPHRPGGVVGCAARRRVRVGQSAARGRADRADGAVTVPADLAPIRQPDVPAGGGGPRVRLPPAPRAGSARHRHSCRGARSAPSRSTATRAWQAKRAALESIYHVELSAGRQIAYQAFRRREGRSLHDFATWCALAEHYGGDWHQWPEELQHPRGAAVAEFAAEHPDEVDFHRWLQWLIDEQLAAAQAAAVRPGMELGIMHDLAVGVDPDGADAWALQDVLAAGVTAGAPPDEFNQLGQDWSQPPWRPDRLAEPAYEPFRALVGAVLRHAGGVRIDHIIGLFRLWWIPKGAAPDGGHLRALRPRGDDRHRGPGGASGRRGRRR